MNPRESNNLQRVLDPPMRNRLLCRCVKYATITKTIQSSSESVTSPDATLIEPWPVKTVPIIIPVRPREVALNELIYDFPPLSRASPLMVAEKEAYP